MTFSGFGFRAPRCRSCNSVQGYTVESSFNSHLFLYSHRIARRQRFFSETHIREVCEMQRQRGAPPPPRRRSPRYFTALPYGFIYIRQAYALRFTPTAHATHDTQLFLLIAVHYCHTIERSPTDQPVGGHRCAAQPTPCARPGTAWSLHLGVGHVGVCVLDLAKHKLVLVLDEELCRALDIDKE